MSILIAKRAILAEVLMKMLLIHGDFKYRTKERVKIRIVETAKKEWEEFENVLVVFTCVEKQDVDKPEILRRAIGEITTVADRVKTNRIVLYPYAHLSDSLARPTSALSILKNIGDELQGRGREVSRSPFGYYKEFVLHCYGHPVAETFRVL